MGETESRLLPESGGAGRAARERSDSSHVRLQEERDEEVDAEDVAPAERLKAKGEVLVFVRYPAELVVDAQGPGEGGGFTNDHFRTLLGTLQKVTHMYSPV